MAHDPDTEDALLDDLLDTVLNMPRSPRAKARSDRWLAHMDARDARPLVDRILDNARTKSRAEYLTAWEEQRDLAYKDTLSEDDRDRLQESNLWSEDCPYAQPMELMVTLKGMGPAHYDEYIQEQVWELLWWADYLEYDCEEHLLAHTDLYGPNTIAAVKASEPYPKGWKPETRRG